MDQHYLGIDKDDSWILVQRMEGGVVFVQSFKDTEKGIHDLVRFIRKRCLFPRICLKASDDAALNLLKYLCNIPRAEVIFVTNAGFSLYQAWIPKHKAGPLQAAETLALCAERVI